MVNYALLVAWEHERQLRILRALFEGTEEERRTVLRMRGPLVFAGLLLARPREPDNKRVVARLHAAQLQVGLRLYEAETGRPAKALEELVRRRYFTAVPADPFDGRPFRYRLSKGEKIEWSEDNAEGLQLGADGPMMPPGGGMGMPAMPAMPGMPGPVGGVMPGGPAAGPPAMPAPGGAGAPPLPPGAAMPPGLGGAGGMMGAGGPPLAQEEWRPPVKEVPAGQGVLWSVGEDGQDDGGLRRPPPNQPATMAGQDLIYLVPLPPSLQPPPKKPARR
jgi:hypothetical protein